MSQEGLDGVRRAFEAWTEGDLSSALDALSPELVTVVHEPIPLAGTYRGPEGLLQLTVDWAEPFDELVVTAEEHIDAGDRVVTCVRHESRGAESGAPVEANIWYVWTIRGGRAVRADIYNERSEALEAAGVTQ